MSGVGFIITFHPFSTHPQEANLSHSDDFDYDPEAERLENDLGSSDPLVRARALLQSAQNLLHADSQDSVAGIYLEEALSIFLAANDAEKVGETAYHLGSSLSSSKQYERAIEVHLQGAEYARRAIDDSNELLNIQSIAWIYKRLKQHAKAAEYFALAYDLAVSQSHWALKFIAPDYARSLRKIGNFERAAELLRVSVEEGRATGEDFPIVIGDQELAAVLIAQGKYEEALAAATEAFNIAVYVDQGREAERAQFYKARALNMLGRHEEALEELMQIKVYKRYKSKNKHRLRVDFEIAKARVGLGEHSVAADLFKQIIPLFDSFNVRDTAVEAMFHSAMNYMAVGNDLDAEYLLIACLERKADSGLASLELDASALLGAIYESREQWDRVVGVYEPLASNPTNQFSAWFPSVLQSLAMAYFALGRMEDADAAAAQVLTTGVKLDPSLVVGDSLAVRAGVASANGEVARARKFGRQAIKAYLAGGFSTKASALADKYL